MTYKQGCSGVGTHGRGVSTHFLVWERFLHYR